MRLRRKVTSTPSVVRELAYRKIDGLHVQLLWHPIDDSVSVSVDDERTGKSYRQPVPGEKALLAFEHPFAFVA